MRYISFSGGADSTAMAILLQQQGIKFELLFADTGAELPETYWLCTEAAKKLGVKLNVVGNNGFYLWLVQYGYLLPSPIARWCTRILKQVPLNARIKEDDICYIGIRAEEAHRAKIRAVYTIKYPLIEAGMVKKDVLALCRKHDLLNPCYDWRTNCSCFCCPFQRKQDWRGLAKYHPNLYRLAEQWEDTSVHYAIQRGHTEFRWSQNFTLKALREATDAQVDMFRDCEAEACLICKYS